MRRSLMLAVFALVALPTAGRADDAAPLYPDEAVFAFGIDVKGIMASPLGKKVIGNDKPFDATRKLLAILFPENILPVPADATGALAAVANKLDRATITGHLGGQSPFVIFLEGTATDEEYSKAAETIAKARDLKFGTDKLGERTLLIIGEDAGAHYGVRVSKSLFVIASQRPLLTEVIAKHAGEKKSKTHPGLADALKMVKPAETPIWLAVGEVGDNDMTLNRITATIGLKDDVDFRVEIVCVQEAPAKKMADILEQVATFLSGQDSPSGRVWKAAGVKVKVDGKTVLATGSVPGKLLADEYAKQK